MSKKLIYLISFILVLGSVSNAEDIQWTDLGADHIWSTPENWDLGRVPTLVDDVRIDVPAAAMPNGPIIQDGIDAKANGIFTEAPGEPTLTMTGGTLEVAGWIWWGDGADSFGIWDMSGGTVTVANEFELGWGGGAGTLTLTGGTINAGEAVIPTGSGAFGELYLHGGTYTVTKADGLSVQENGLIDITEGTLVLEGDDTAKINDLIAAGLITAYGGDGKFELDFDGRNPGKTTLTAIPAPIAGPVLKLDVGNSHNAEELEEGFTSFTLAESGSDVDGITIEFAGINSGDSRRRGEPSGVPYENIYRDFIFGRQSEAGVGLVTVTLSGLQANQTYLITLYSWDTNSTEIRIADWTANGEFLFSTIHDGNVDPPAAEDDYAYTGAATADANGVILMEAVPGEGTFAAEPFAFINALVLVPIEPVLKLDVGNSHNAEELEEGFTSFTLAESGSDVDGITIEFAGINSGDSRRRGEPAGVPFENIYRDFIFGRQSEVGVGLVTVTLSGLEANQTYGFTLYSWDTNSTNIRIADWTANGKFLFSTIHDGNVDPPAAQDDYAYTGAATADANGVIFMEAVPGEGTFAAEPFAFINALVLSAPVPTEPEPVGPVTDGLVAYYPLENDVLDGSGNGNDGTIFGNPTYVEGPSGYGTAMEFHGLGAPGGGGDYIDCGNDASLDITGPISIALWIRPGADDPEGQGTETAPMAKAMDGVGWSWQVRYGWGSPQPYMAFTFNTSPRAWAYVGQNLVRDEWAHIACSHDGTTLKCYLNGEQTDSTPMGQITSSEAPVLIGSDGWGCDWIGAIDEVAIYNRALSDSEIMHLAGN